MNSNDNNSSIRIDITSTNTRKKDIIFFLVNFILIILIVYLLFASIRLWPVPSFLLNRLPFLFEKAYANTLLIGIGKIKNVENNVRRKTQNTGIFENIQIMGNNTIYENDTIRTGENSKIDISLNQGIEFSLSPLSLVTIKALGNQNSEIVVEKGIVNTSDGEEIQQGQSLLQDKEGRIKVKKLPFKIISPEPYSLKKISTDLDKVTFSWEQTESEPVSKIEIADNKNFKPMSRMYDEITDSTYTVELEEGTWYWRISNGESQRESMFTMIRTYRPAPIFPPENSEIKVSSSTEQIIKMRWGIPKNAISYDVRIFSEKEQEKTDNNTVC